MRYFDENPNVLKWSSEEVIVPYKSPLDGRYHRYFPDFLIRVKNKQGNLETIMIEVEHSQRDERTKTTKAFN